MTRNLAGIPERRLHEYYMRMALSFARRGIGRVSPNPRVGCVIVDYASPGGEVVSCGFHKSFGGPHAETEAVKNALRPVRGMTAYVTLEPCCHTGHTPPCCDALISAGITRVVIGMTDPDPRVSGGGTAKLAAAGIEVVPSELEDECRRLNRGFVKRMTKGRPWVTIKAAVSMDGDIALRNGESKWITGIPARRLSHLMRAENDAVMIGIGSALKDDPELSVRDSEGRSPLKVIVDKDLEIPMNARVLKGEGAVVFTSCESRGEKISELLKRGVKVIKTRGGGRIRPDVILKELAAMGVNYVMLEGGSGLISSFIEDNAADEAAFFTAPKLMGDGMQMARGLRFASMSFAVGVKNVRAKAVGADFLFRGEF